MRRERQYILCELALVILIGVLPIFLLGALTYPRCVEEPPSPFPYIELSESVHATCVWLCYATFVLAPLCAISMSGKPASYFGIRTRGWADVPAGVKGCAVNYLAGWILWIGYRATGFPLGVESIRAFHYIHANSPGEMVATWPWYVLVVLAEELMARCYLITRLRDLTGDRWAAICISAALYAFWHLFWGWAGAAHVFVAGIIFGVMFFRFRGAAAAGIGHWLFDALTLLPR